MSNPTAVARPSFFKPLINDYSTVLRLPISFVRAHRNVLPENTKLRIQSGKIWDVKMEGTDDDDECFFTEGWSDFVEDLELQPLQMLFFWLNAGDGTFDVSVYEQDSNEREFTAAGGGSSSDVVVLESSDGGEVTPTPSPQAEATEMRRGRQSRHVWKSWRRDDVFRFVRELKEHHFNVKKMVIPKEFGLRMGLATDGGKIEVENSRKRKWKISVRSHCGGFIMSGGFQFLLRENHLQLRDILLFEFDPNSAANVVKFVVMTNEDGKEMLAQSGKCGIICLN